MSIYIFPIGFVLPNGRRVLEYIDPSVYLTTVTCLIGSHKLKELEKSNLD